MKWFFDKDNQGFGETLPPIRFTNGFGQMKPSFWEGMEFLKFVTVILFLLLLVAFGLWVVGI